MAKTTSVFVRVEPQVKEQAEMVLNQLGIPMSNAIGMFLQQVVLQKGIPFELKLPAAKPIAYGALSQQEFDEMMKAALSDLREGKTISLEEARAQLEKEFGICLGK